MSEFIKLFEFINQSEDYTLGFEYGYIYKCLKEGEELDMRVHNENVEQITKCCEMFGIEPYFDRLNKYFTQLVIKGTTV